MGIRRSVRSRGDGDRRDGRNGAGHGFPRPSKGTDMTLFTIFGSTEHKERTRSFDGGKAVTIFGSAELDLTQSAMQQDEVLIELFTIFGSTVVRVPETWAVNWSGLTLMGAVEGLSHGNGPKARRVVIQGLTLFGSCEILRGDPEEAEEERDA